MSINKPDYLYVTSSISANNLRKTDTIREHEFIFNVRYIVFIRKCRVNVALFELEVIEDNESNQQFPQCTVYDNNFNKIDTLKELYKFLERRISNEY